MITRKLCKTWGNGKWGSSLKGTFKEAFWPRNNLRKSVKRPLLIKTSFRDLKVVRSSRWVAARTSCLSTSGNLKSNKPSVESSNPHPNHKISQSHLSNVSPQHTTPTQLLSTSDFKTTLTSSNRTSSKSANKYSKTCVHSSHPATTNPSRDIPKITRFIASGAKMRFHLSASSHFNKFEWMSD